MKATFLLVILALCSVVSARNVQLQGEASEVVPWIVKTRAITVVPYKLDASISKKESSKIKDKLKTIGQKMDVEFTKAKDGEVFYLHIATTAACTENSLDTQAGTFDKIVVCVKPKKSYTKEITAGVALGLDKNQKLIDEQTLAAAPSHSLGLE